MHVPPLQMFPVPYLATQALSSEGSAQVPQVKLPRHRVPLWQSPLARQPTTQAPPLQMYPAPYLVAHLPSSVTSPQVPQLLFLQRLPVEHDASVRQLAARQVPPTHSRFEP